MKRSVMREGGSVPDCASLHPGYEDNNSAALGRSACDLSPAFLLSFLRTRETVGARASDFGFVARLGPGFRRDDGCLGYGSYLRTAAVGAAEVQHGLEDGALRPAAMSGRAEWSSRMRAGRSCSKGSGARNWSPSPTRRVFPATAACRNAWLSTLGSSKTDMGHLPRWGFRLARKLSDVIIFHIMGRIARCVPRGDCLCHCTGCFGCFSCTKPCAEKNETGWAASPGG